ncbi:MAG: hypothetical protein A4E35_01978 [Methanoregula sp. PtaU1.Bin051]|nr:MAG: hypothetical protein A4E35_01978 [Methanoregula sp. PtaU1.Bin051]
MDLSAKENNRRVAAILYEAAEILNARGERFKPQAYAKAARAVEALREDIAEVSGPGELEKIPEVGTHIAAKICEIVGTGGLSYLEKLRKELPEGVQELSGIEGIGLKRVKVLVKEFNVRNVRDLEAAAAAGRVRDLPGFGEQNERRILVTIRGSSAPGRGPFSATSCRLRRRSSLHWPATPQRAGSALPGLSGGGRSRLVISISS